MYDICSLCPIYTQFIYKSVVNFKDYIEIVYICFIHEICMFCIHIVSIKRNFQDFIYKQFFLQGIRNHSFCNGLLIAVVMEKKSLQTDFFLYAHGYVQAVQNINNNFRIDALKPR